MNIRLLALFALSVFTTACSNMASTVNEIHLKKGDLVQLGKPFTVPDLYAHIILQGGNVVNQRSLQVYSTSCIIGVNRLGPETYPPAEFEVSEVSYNEEWYSNSAGTIRYYTEIHLKPRKQGDGILLTCQLVDDTMRHHSFPLSEIQQAVGDYFIFSTTDNTL